MALATVTGSHVIVSLERRTFADDRDIAGLSPWRAASASQRERVKGRSAVVTSGGAHGAVAENAAVHVSSIGNIVVWVAVSFIFSSFPQHHQCSGPENVGASSVVDISSAFWFKASSQQPPHDGDGSSDLCCHRPANTFGRQKRAAADSEPTRGRNWIAGRQRQNSGTAVE